MKSLCLLLISLFVLLTDNVLAKQVVRFNLATNANQEHCVSLIKLALAPYADKYEIKPTLEYLTQARQLAELDGGGLDVIWVATTPEFESEFAPVRIPLFKGLLGNRVFLIKESLQGKFRSIQSVRDIQKFKLGQGKTWADTKILEAAGFDIVTANKYENLFPMLEGERFDLFPRGIQEPWSEIVDHRDLGLAVEEGLMLVYPMPLYFFVNKQNTQLQKDLTAGLELAIKNGEFDRTFYASRLVQDVLDKANMEERKVFKIDNPFLTSNTPLNRAELWYQH